MARTSKNCYSFSQEIYQTLGFGNPKLFTAFCISSCILLFALISSFLPGLGTILIWFLPLIVGAGIFLVITGAHPEDSKLSTVLFGLVIGLIAGALTHLLATMLLSLSPIITGLLLLPNIVALGSYCLGEVIHFFEICCSSIATCFKSNNPHQENKTELTYHEKPQRDNQIVWDNISKKTNCFLATETEYDWALFRESNRKTYEPSAPSFEEIDFKFK